jgi:hypothetical protein
MMLFWRLIPRPDFVLGTLAVFGVLALTVWWASRVTVEVPEVVTWEQSTTTTTVEEADA